MSRAWVYFISLQVRKYIPGIAYLSAQGVSVVLPTERKLQGRSLAESLYVQIYNFPVVLILLVPGPIQAVESER